MNNKQIARELVKLARSLTVPERHQKNIALKTLKMSDAGARVMGGMTKEEAREFLQSIGYSESKIRRLEGSRLAKGITSDDYPYAVLTFKKDRVEFRVQYGATVPPSFGAEPYRRNVPAAIVRVLKVIKKHKVSDENIEVIG